MCAVEAVRLHPRPLVSRQALTYDTTNQMPASPDMGLSRLLSLAGYIAAQALSTYLRPSQTLNSSYFSTVTKSGEYEPAATWFIALGLEIRYLKMDSASSSSSPNSMVSAGDRHLHRTPQVPEDTGVTQDLIVRDEV